MANSNKVKKTNGSVSEETLRKSIEFQRIGNRAVHRAQEESRRLGVPNWYSINGKIISDLDIRDDKKKGEWIIKSKGKVSVSVQQLVALKNKLKKSNRLLDFFLNQRDLAEKFETEFNKLDEWTFRK